MNYKRLFWGVLLILLGAVIVLHNMGIINFEWWQLWKLWPLAFILWGVSLLPFNNYVKLAISFLTLALGILLVSNYDKGRSWSFGSPFEWRRYRSEDSNERKNRSGDWENERQYLMFPYNKAIARAELRLDAAAGKFNIGDTSQQLVELVREGNIGNYSLTSHEEDGKHTVNLKLENGIRSGSNIRHKVDIKLNDMPEWDFDLNVGAADATINLKKLKVAAVRMDGGASSIRLILGDRSAETNVRLQAGASSITVEIPENSGCRITAKSALSGRSFKGFKEKERNIYETDNFDQSAHKIFIHGDVAVSSFEVKKYMD